MTRKRKKIEGIKQGTTIEEQKNEKRRRITLFGAATEARELWIFSRLHQRDNRFGTNRKKNINTSSTNQRTQLAR